MRTQQPPSLTPADSEATQVLVGTGTSALKPGFLLGHTYLIENLIARGGMGEVYRAKHIELGTEHVIKVVLPSLANDPKIVELFRGEARKLARLRIDAVVHYEGFFRDERGLLYLVMEFVEGESLAAILAQRRLESDEVLRLRDRLAAGLAAAHDLGIVHRDISPDNIILPDGRVERAKLIDFGIAKSTDPGDLTLIGSDFVGKYSFVSPEQAGLFGGHVDLRSDIYSLGLVLAYSAIGFGKKLDMGSSSSTMIAARQRVPDLSAVPPSLRPVIAQMLQPRPDDRPGSMRELLGDRGAEPSAAAKGRGVFAIGAGVLLGLSLAALLVWRPWEPPASPDEIRKKVAEIIPRYRCASLDYDVGADRSVHLTGFAIAPDGVEGLRHDIAEIRGVRALRLDVRPRDRPYCDVAGLLNPFLQGNKIPFPAISLASGTAEASVGEQLCLNVRAPDFDGYIYIDYFDAAGEVLHLFPSVTLPWAHKTKRTPFILGQPPNDWTLGGSIGEQLVTLVGGKKPLFAELRPQVEKASDYLASLSDAIGKAPQDAFAAATVFFDLNAARSSGNIQRGCPP